MQEDTHLHMYMSNNWVCRYYKFCIVKHTKHITKIYYKLINYLCSWYFVLTIKTYSRNYSFRLRAIITGECRHTMTFSIDTNSILRTPFGASLLELTKSLYAIRTLDYTWILLSNILEIYINSLFVVLTSILIACNRNSKWPISCCASIFIASLFNLWCICWTNYSTFKTSTIWWVLI